MGVHSPNLWCIFHLLPVENIVSVLSFAGEVHRESGEVSHRSVGFVAFVQRRQDTIVEEILLP